MVNNILFRLGLVDIKKSDGVKIKLNKQQFNYNGKVILEKDVQLSAYDNGAIHLGKNVKICECSKLLACDGKIIIGDSCQLGDYNYITGQGGVTIQDNVLFASHVNIISNEHIYENIEMPIVSQKCIKKKILIKEGSWIGISSTILGGTIIGKNCVVGANSLVKGEFPDYCVIAGNPAKVIKKYDFSLQSWVKV